MVELRDIDPSGDRPVYKQIADALLEAIGRGDFPVGARLPSEAELMVRYQVAQGTIRNALGVLRGEGRVVAEHGRGVFVQARSTSSGPNIVGAFGLVVRFIVREGREDDFDELVAATIADIHRHEPGTLLYVSHRVADAPRQRIFYELYRDRAAFDAHEAQPHTRRFLAARDDLLEAVEVDFVSPIAIAGGIEGR